MKTEVIRLSQEKEDQKLLADRAKEIRRDPAFKALLAGLPKTPAARLSQLRSFAANGGAQLETSLNNARQQLEQQSPAMGL